VRRLIALAGLAVAAWWLISRRRGAGDDSAATIGYSDGSSVTFDPGSAELERFVHIAAGAKPG
jgi:hypothetical protein